MGTMYTAKLSVTDAAFPLLSRNSGRPTIIPGVDSNNTDETTPMGLAGNASSVFNAVAKPHLVYLENVLPRNGGFSSVGYVPMLASQYATNLPLYSDTLQLRNMSKTDLAQEPVTIIIYEDMSIAYLSATLQGHIAAPAAFTDTPLFSLGNSSGFQFLLMHGTVAGVAESLLGELRLNSAGTALEYAVIFDSVINPPGISAADFALIKYCASAGNYLILAKEDGTLYWNDTTPGKLLQVASNQKFIVGQSIKGATSGATATYKAVAGTAGMYLGATDVGNFTVGETLNIIGSVSSVALNTASTAGFQVGEPITGLTSGATATVGALAAGAITLGGVYTGIFGGTEQVQGGNSFTVATLTSVTNPTGITTTVAAAIIDALDWTPSSTTGAGFEIPSMMSGTVIGLQQFGDGFIVHTTSGSIFAKYSQNSALPWVFSTVWNSDPVLKGQLTTKPIITDSPTALQQFSWTQSGLMSISLTNNAQNVFPEVSDFLTGELLEVLSPDKLVGTPVVTDAQIVGAETSMDVSISRVSNRYLCISYGQYSATSRKFSQVLIYDVALKRWGKLVVDHCAVISLPPQFANVTGLHNIGIVDTTGAVFLVTEENVYYEGTMQVTVQHQGVVIMGGINFNRGNVAQIATVAINFGNLQIPDPNAESVKAYWAYAPDAINISAFQQMKLLSSATGTGTWGIRKIAAYHFVKLYGSFHLSSLEVKLSKAGNR
jgi:hypothetical protein